MFEMKDSSHAYSHCGQTPVCLRYMEDSSGGAEAESLVQLPELRTHETVLLYYYCSYIMMEIGRHRCRMLTGSKGFIPRRSGEVVEGCPGEISNVFGLKDPSRPPWPLLYSLIRGWEFLEKEGNNRFGEKRVSVRSSFLGCLRLSSPRPSVNPLSSNGGFNGKVAAANDYSISTTQSFPGAVSFSFDNWGFLVLFPPASSSSLTYHHLPSYS